MLVDTIKVRGGAPDQATDAATLTVFCTVTLLQHLASCPPMQKDEDAFLMESDDVACKLPPVQKDRGSSGQKTLMTGEGLFVMENVGIAFESVVEEALECCALRQGCTFVNQYVVIKTLGQGAYGKVKLCLNAEDHGLYALKLISKVRLCS
jgi:hypothetical protein